MGETLNIKVAQGIILAINILMAWYHARLIKADRPIRHGWWAALYITLCGALCLFAESGWLAIFAILIRKPLFDVSLNYFRGKPLFYVASDPDSLIDDIHLTLFGKKNEWYLLFYAVAALIVSFLK